MKLGRLIAPDARDRDFPMRLMLDPLREQFFPSGLPEGSRHYSPGAVLDQGETGTCVAHGWTSRANGAPIKQTLPYSPYDLYRRIVAIDEWTQNDFEAGAPDASLQFGTSVRAGAKVLQDLGYLKQYLWAESAEDVRAWHLAGFGTNVFGVWWHTGMIQADTQGFIRPTGVKEGGHCIVTTAWNDKVRWNGRRVRACRIQNSHGRQFGQNGRAWIEMDDLHKLLTDQGESCAPVEVKVKK